MKPLGLAVALLLIASPAAARTPEINARTIDRTLSLLEHHYWLRDRIDWPAVANRYRAALLDAADDASFYQRLNDLLDGLGGSHVYATAPEDEAIVDTRSARWLPDGILLVRFDDFDDGADRWLAAQLAARPKALIVDLRANDGGDSRQLDRIAGLFAVHDAVIAQVVGKRTIEERVRGAGGGAYAGRLALLVGPDSASAAELLAAFVDENRLGFVVGETTAGRVLSGVEYRLPDQGQLMIAEADILTGAGRRIEGKGYSPPYSAPAATALDRAIALVRPD